MSKYTEYDQKLLGLIENGCSNFDSLCNRLSKENAVLSETRDSWRVTDRRLQALRRAGKIAFDKSRKTWNLEPSK